MFSCLLYYYVQASSAQPKLLTEGQEQLPHRVVSGYLSVNKVQVPKMILASEVTRHTNTD